jgi:hypothetical protein
MTQKTRKDETADDEPKLTDAGKTRQPRRIPERYDILIHCRDETEQRDLFERLRGEGVSLRLLVL